MSSGLLEVTLEQHRALMLEGNEIILNVNGVESKLSYDGCILHSNEGLTVTELVLSNPKHIETEDTNFSLEVSADNEGHMVITNTWDETLDIHVTLSYDWREYPVQGESFTLVLDEGCDYHYNFQPTPEEPLDPLLHFVEQTAFRVEQNLPEWYKFILDEKVQGHLNGFITNFRITHPTDELGCDSFDDLVYVEPERNSYLAKADLTEEQLDYVLKQLPFIHNGMNREVYICFDDCDYLWYGCGSHIGDKKLSFNDIFVHKSMVDKV